MTFTTQEIEEARRFFEASFQASRASNWDLGIATWFQREGKPSIHREAVYGYEPTYSVD